ncbi:MAG: hypothetical protein H2174_08905 [Vampirovibrio sp.]|nr:hypothetical protein [Vampirovibrio sp.]
MISIDFTLLLVFLAFLVFVQLFKRAFFDKIAALQAERLLAVQQAQEGADSAVARCLELETTYEATLQEAHRQAKLTVGQAKQKAKKQFESTISSTRQSLESELLIHVSALQANKRVLLEDLLVEKEQFLPLLEQQLVPSSSYSQQQGASSV